MEQLIANEYLNALLEHWIIHREIWGQNTLSGKMKRIDAIIVNKEIPNKIFGIEFKRDELKPLNYFTKWFKQTLIYTQTDWAGFGKIPILMAPEINYYESSKMEMSRFIGDFGIGCLTKKIYSGLTRYQIILKEDRIWCNQNGWNKVYIKTDFKKYLEL